MEEFDMDENENAFQQVDDVGDNHDDNGAAEDQDDEDADDEDEEEDILDMGEEDHAPDSDALLMRFCPHDSSMLYPQEARNGVKALNYACRLCRYTEGSTQPLIYRNVLKKEVGNVLHTVPSSVSDDPTLARSQNANCANCGHQEAVFFQPSDSRSDTLALIFVCCNCDFKWVN